MGIKGKAGSLISGFMSGFNAERDRREKKRVQTHQETMDASLKEYREVTAAAAKTAAEVAAEDRKRDEATVQGMMEQNPEEFKYWLEEEIVSQPDFMGDTEPTMQSFMGGGDQSRRKHMAPTLEFATGKMERVSQEKQTAATTDLRKAQATAATMNAETRKKVAENEAYRLKVATDREAKSAEVLVAITKHQFPGTAAQLEEKGVSMDNLDLNSIKIVRASLLKEVSDSTLTLAQQEEKLMGLREMLISNTQRTDALLAKSTTMDDETKSGIEARQFAITDAVNDSILVLEEKIRVRRLAGREITEGPQEASPPLEPPVNMMGDAQTEAMPNVYGSAGPPESYPQGQVPGVQNTRDVGDNPSNF